MIYEIPKYTLLNENASMGLRTVQIVKYFRIELNDIFIENVKYISHEIEAETFLH